ncbi:hypothetical protein, partial [Yersinia wautersii]|uniref:hypothetical protein n=1 Tax=Yersinia wautersii TaxID=1341643 RepID=UPI001EE39073
GVAMTAPLQQISFTAYIYARKRYDGDYEYNVCSHDMSQYLSTEVLIGTHEVILNIPQLSDADIASIKVDSLRTQKEFITAEYHRQQS